MAEAAVWRRLKFRHAKGGNIHAVFSRLDNEKNIPLKLTPFHCVRNFFYFLLGNQLLHVRFLLQTFSKLVI